MPSSKPSPTFPPLTLSEQGSPDQQWPQKEQETKLGHHHLHRALSRRHHHANLGLYHMRPMGSHQEDQSRSREEEERLGRRRCGGAEGGAKEEGNRGVGEWSAGEFVVGVGARAEV